jgi:hypothetical protein
MPPLARNTVDHSAVATVAEWIGRLPAASIVQGLRAEYFDNVNLTGLVQVRTDPAVNFNWGSGSPIAGMRTNSFSVRWSGEIVPPLSERYTFRATADDGVRLWIGDQLLIDDWQADGLGIHSGTLDLEAGQRYALRLEYFENLGGAQVRLEWSSPSLTREVIPSNRLTSLSEIGVPFPGSVLRLVSAGDSSMRIVVDADQTGNHSVEASTNLVNWTELIRFVDRSGLIEFQDPEATNHPLRFYRAGAYPTP